MSRLLACLLAGLLLLGLSATALAQAAPTDAADDDDPSAMVDPLDVRQGGDLPPPPPPTAAPAAPASISQQTLDQFVGFFVWALDAPLTATQRQDLQDAAVQAFSSNDQASMSTVTQMASVYQQLAQVGETQRIQLRNQLQPQLLDQARAQPNDEFSRWLLDVYASAHQPIAAGTPPLTRQVADANAEVTYFLLQVVATGDASIDGLKLGQALLDNWASSLAQDYPSYSAQQQQQLAKMPLFRAAMAEGWSQLSAADRAALRDQWRPIAQAWLGGTSCDAFSQLAQGGLVEASDANVARYRQCNPQLQQAAPPQPQVSRAQSQAAYEAAMAHLQASHNAYVGMSNALLTQHVATMNMLNTFSGSPYEYVIK
jgi:hypothetical protein